MRSSCFLLILSGWTGQSAVGLWHVHAAAVKASSGTDRSEPAATTRPGRLASFRSIFSAGGPFAKVPPVSATRRTGMLGTTLDVRPFLERVGQELLRINPAEVKALADAIYDCYERGRFVFLIG